MDYLVPSWHKQLVDWAYSTPEIQFDDTVSHMKVFQHHQRKVGLVIMDYLPQLTTQLSQIALAPDKIFSLFDYLQDVKGFENQVVDYLDFDWPDGAIFDYTNFRLFVVVKGKVYAKITFDTQSKIHSIAYFKDGNIDRRLLMDSRGFISSEEHEGVETYFSPSGVWRFKRNKETDHVIINNSVFPFCRHSEYAHMQDLLIEVMQEQFLSELKSTDNLIVTLDDHMSIPIDIYQKYHPIYSISHWHQYSGQLPDKITSKVVFDSQELLQRFNYISNGEVIPLFQSQFKLGHSQRLSQQRIAIFAENMSHDELAEMLEQLYPRLIANPLDEAVHIFAYSIEKSSMANQVIRELHQKHSGEFILSMNEIDPGENQIEKEDIPPLLSIKVKRLTSTAEVLRALDKIRTLIIWNKNDQFMEIAGISVGIPIIQNFESIEVMDHKNGIVCDEISNISEFVSYYLDSLKHWNESLVHNVKVMNHYSEDNIFAKWQAILERKVQK
ncbi:MAG: accessory Sec system protein Asp1 [Lactobacillus sp.]|nr:accessory Sec system protein Asp1 [Lactobacillus sp.]